MRTPCLSCALFCGLFVAVPALARLDLIPGSRYTPARAAAVGDAMLPVGEDVASGLFLNPAHLTRIPKFNLEMVNFSVYGNTGYTSSLGTSFYQIANLSQYQSIMQSHPGTNIGAGGALAIAGGFRGFGMGLLAQSQLSGQANSDGSMNYRTLYQMIPAMGGGFQLLNGVFRFGTSIQWVHESVGSRQNIVTTSPSYLSNIYEGSGFSVTAAATLTVPMKSLPAFNFVARNIGGTTFSGASLLPLASSSLGAPPMEAMTFDGSFSIQPHVGHGVTMNLMFVDRDFTDTTRVTLMGHLAMGGELIFKSRFFLRGGWRGGYPSAGIGLRNRGAELGLTWFTEEIGTGFMSKGDTKYLLQYQLSSF